MRTARSLPTITGVAAGAAFEMYNLTGEQQYLDTAVEIMDKAFTKFTSDGLTIVDEGTGDSAGFKTIMLRVAAQMYNSGTGGVQPVRRISGGQCVPGMESPQRV